MSGSDADTDLRRAGSGKAAAEDVKYAKKSSRRRHSRSRSRSRSKDRRGKRSRSRDKKARKSRSASRDKRKRSRSRDRKKTSSRRSRSRSRDRNRRHRSRSRDRRRRRSPSSSDNDRSGGTKSRPPEVIVINGPGTGADPFASMRVQAVTQDPQVQMRTWQLQQLEARAMVLEQQSKAAANPNAKTQREVYVGGLAQGAVGGEALRTLFNAALAAQFSGYLIPGMDPVINVSLHPEGKFAFVEFRAPEMASAALALNQQVQLQGTTLTVARPSGFVDTSKAVSAFQAASKALAAFKRGDLQALAAAAMAGANLKGLGLPTHIEDPVAAANPNLPPGVIIEGATGLPTPCLCFLGMVTAARLKDDQAYEDMKEDLREQFNAFVPESCVEIKVPRPHDPLLADQYIGLGNFGRIFTKMVSTHAATVCREKINGRLYAGLLVQVFYISEAAYANI